MKNIPWCGECRKPMKYANDIKLNCVLGIHVGIRYICGDCGRSVLVPEKTMTHNEAKQVQAETVKANTWR